jgi:hypothetical protein
MGTSTPWGTADYSKKYGTGVMFYGTPSHGGFHLTAKRNALVNAAWRRADGWYEEDCDWAIVALTFPELFTTEDIASAHSSAKNWRPDGYTAVFGVPVDPTESSVLRDRAFAKAHENDFVTVAAWGDWAEGVPEGMVGVVATRGGSRKPGAEEKWFLVPADEYKGTFVVDAARHAEIAKLTGRAKREVA